MTIQITSAALQDIEDIRAFTIDHWGRAQWLEYYQGMTAVFDRIAAAPDSGRNRHMQFPGMRSANYRAHLTFYRRTKAAKDAPVVLRIIHQRRNLPALHYMESL